MNQASNLENLEKEHTKTYLEDGRADVKSGRWQEYTDPTACFHADKKYIIYMLTIFIYIYMHTSSVQCSNNILTNICAMNTFPVVKQNAILLKNSENSYDSRIFCKWTTNHSSTKQIQTISFEKFYVFYIWGFP